MLEALPPSQWNAATAAHLMNRAGFGGSPQDIENLRLMGMNRAVSWFLDYEKIPDPTPAPDCSTPDPKLIAQREAIVLDHEQDRRAPLAGAVQSLVKLALAGHALAAGDVNNLVAFVCGKLAVWRRLSLRERFGKSIEI